MRLPNRSGFSVLELVIASLIGAVGFMGAAGVYSYVGVANRGLEARRAAAAVADAVKRGLAQDQKASWLALSGSGCTSNPTTTLTFPSFNGAEFDVQLLDAAKLATLLPENLPNGSVNPVRKAISDMISQYGADASIQCADPSVLHDPKYSVLAESEKNQVLCRCASAVTPYGTLQGRLTGFQTRKSLYACVEIGPASTSPSPANESILAESNYSLFDAANNAQKTCQQIAGSVPAKALSRLEYAFFAIQQQSKTTGAFLMD